MSRGVQWRLFMLVAGLMLVAMLVQRVRDPKFWHFMGFTERPIAGGPPLADHELAPPDLDTRLRLAPGAHDESGAEVITIPAGTTADTPPAATSEQSKSAAPQAAHSRRHPCGCCTLVLVFASPLSSVRG